MLLECAIATAGIGLLTGVHFRGTKNLRTTYVCATIERKPLPHPVRILHLSDFHASWCVPVSFIDQAITLGLAQSPDLICVTGDFISWRYRRMTEYVAVLKRLSEAAPTFACSGNHDGGRWNGVRLGPSSTRWLRCALERAGIHPLLNESAQVAPRGVPLYLAGLADMSEEKMDAEAAFAAIPSHPESACILLVHNPDAKDRVNHYPWDLMLAGHTHGGQVCVPFFNTVQLPVRDCRYVAGLYSWNERLIHITRGVGNIHGIRYNCPPEVSIVDLA